MRLVLLASLRILRGYVRYISVHPLELAHFSFSQNGCLYVVHFSDRSSLERHPSQRWVGLRLRRGCSLPFLLRFSLFAYGLSNPCKKQNLLYLFLLISNTTSVLTQDLDREYLDSFRQYNPSLLQCLPRMVHVIGRGMFIHFGMSLLSFI